MNTRAMKFHRSLSEWFSFGGYMPCESSNHCVLGVPRWHHGELRHAARQSRCHLHFLGVISDKESKLSGKKDAHQGAQRSSLWWLPPWSTHTASCFALVASPWAFRDAKLPTQRQVAHEKSVCLIFGKLSFTLCLPFYSTNPGSFCILYHILTVISPTLENFSSPF